VSVAGAFDLEVLAAQDALDHGPNRVVVIDDQDFLLTAGLLVRLLLL
jgi:hypothetical protein